MRLSRRKARGGQPGSARRRRRVSAARRFQGGSQRPRDSSRPPRGLRLVLGQRPTPSREGRARVLGAHRAARKRSCDGPGRRCAIAAEGRIAARENGADVRFAGSAPSAHTRWRRRPGLRGRPSPTGGPPAARQRHADAAVCAAKKSIRTRTGQAARNAAPRLRRKSARQRASVRPRSALTAAWPPQRIGKPEAVLAVHPARGAGLHAADVEQHGRATEAPGRPTPTTDRRTGRRARCFARRLRRLAARRAAPALRRRGQRAHPRRAAPLGRGGKRGPPRSAPAARAASVMPRTRNEMRQTGTNRFEPVNR